MSKILSDQPTQLKLKVCVKIWNRNIVYVYTKIVFLSNVRFQLNACACVLLKLLLQEFITRNKILYVYFLFPYVDRYDFTYFVGVKWKIESEAFINLIYTSDYPHTHYTVYSYIALEEEFHFYFIWIIKIESSFETQHNKIQWD